eukprot:scaffold61668_cov44-Cyclotella_meneghiniana.AAC.3
MSDDIDTPAKLVQLDITEQHRTQFNREAFGIDNSGRVIDENSLSKWKEESQIEDEIYMSYEAFEHLYCTSKV